MTDVQSIPDDRRRQIFAALVEAQDQSMTVSDSRRHVAEQFSLSEAQVVLIEREGLDHGWPPL